IARHCGVTQPFVSSMRRSLKTVLSDEAAQAHTSRTYTDRHGHIATMNTAKIGQRAPETPAAVPTPPTSNGTPPTGEERTHRAPPSRVPTPAHRDRSTGRGAPRRGA